MYHYLNCIGPLLEHGDAVCDNYTQNGTAENDNIQLKYARSSTGITKIQLSRVVPEKQAGHIYKSNNQEHRMLHFTSEHSLYLIIRLRWY